METTERIVESYCRYVKQWFTIPNIKCKGQYEIDLLAVDTTSRKIKRYHVECGVSISGSYSKLTAKNFSTNDLKIRIKQAGQRRTMGYFIHRKFELPEVKAELEKYGFVDGNYSKVMQKVARQRTCGSSDRKCLFIQTTEIHLHRLEIIILLITYSNH